MRYQIFLQQLRAAFKLHLIFLFAMFLIRSVAFFTYRPAHPLPLMDLWKVFFLGLRFDNSLLCYLWTPIILLWLLQLGLTKGNSGIHKASVNLLSFLANLIFLLLLVDLQYYSYFQDHLNILAFGFFEDDTTALLHTFWKNYPVIPYVILASVIVFLSHLLIWRSLQIPAFTKSSSLQTPARPFQMAKLFVLPALILFLGVGARGSLGLFPLTVADTVVSSEPFFNYLSFNGVHSLYRAVKLKIQTRVEWDANAKYYAYSNASQAFADLMHLPEDKVPEPPFSLLQKKTALNPWAKNTKPHIVLLVMESFGGHWLKFNSPDFNLLGELQEHWQQDYVVDKFFPGMNATIGSLTSLMINTPQRPFSPFLSESMYANVKFSTAPMPVFKAQGYETRFVYGGNPGWRDIDKFARRQGFDAVEGEVDIKEKLGELREVHDWGIYDEDVLKYVRTLLQEAKKPQLIVVMTTTNHPPYQVPKNYQPKNLNLPQQMLGSSTVDKKLLQARFTAFQYSNDQLGHFMGELKKSSLKDRSIVAATGDHGFLVVNYSDEELADKWKVPFYLYVPLAGRPKSAIAEFGSHQDIFPTLMSLSLSEVTYEAFGNNLFEPTAPHVALHNSRIAMNSFGAVILNQGRDTQYFSWNDNKDRLTPTSESPQLQELATYYRSLMASADYYLNWQKK